MTQSIHIWINHHFYFWFGYMMLYDIWFGQPWVSSNCPHWFCDMRHIWARGKRQPQGVLKCVQVLPARTIGFGASMTTSLSREIWSSEHCFWTCHFRRILRHYSHNTSNLHENRWRQGWLFWHASGSSAHLVQMKPIVYTNLSNNMNITNSHPYIDTVFACISRKSFGFNWNCRCWTYSVQISSVIPHCSDWLRTDFPWWTMIPKLLGNRTHYNHQPNSGFESSSTDTATACHGLHHTQRLRRHLFFLFSISSSSGYDQVTSDWCTNHGNRYSILQQVHWHKS